MTLGVPLDKRLPLRFTKRQTSVQITKAAKPA